MHRPTDRITYTTVFVTPVVEHWLEREIAQWVHHEGCERYHGHGQNLITVVRHVKLYLNKSL